jgi:phosphatidylglycerophosphatase A
MTDTPTDPSPSGPVLRPNGRFLMSHPAHFIALGFGSGLSPLAPGTAGTLWAWLAFSVMQRGLSTTQLGWVIAASMLLGWWACTVTAQHMRVADSGHIVWDEIAAFWLVLWLVVPASFTMQLAAFALFRAFDALKPQPMAWADRHFKGFGARGGFGIMFDDLLAAFCTLLVLSLWSRW